MSIQTINALTLERKKEEKGKEKNILSILEVGTNTYPLCKFTSISLNLLLSSNEGFSFLEASKLT